MFKIDILIQAKNEAEKALKATVDQVKELKSNIDKTAQNAMSGLQSASQNTFNAIKSGAKMAAIGVVSITAALVGIAGKATGAASSVENLEAQLFTVFQGNKAKVDEAKKNITDFAAATPFAIAEVTNGFIKLSNMGLNPSNKALRAYGDTASSMKKSLNDMVEAVADAATGEFERLKEFGIKSKTEGDKVTFTFKDVATTVGKNSKEIEDYLIKLGETNFSGGMERQSQTLTGLISTMKDNINLALADFGKESGMLEASKDVVRFISDLTAKLDFKELGRKTKENLAPLKEAIGEIVPFLQEKFEIVKQLFHVLLTGQFEGNDTIAEDHPLIIFFLKIREAVLSLIAFIQEHWANIKTVFDEISPYIDKFVKDYLNEMIKRFEWLKDNVLPFLIKEGKELADWAKNDLMPAFKQAFEAIEPPLKRFNDMLFNFVDAVWPVLKPVLDSIIEIVKFVLPPALTLTAKAFGLILDAVSWFGYNLADVFRKGEYNINNFVRFVEGVGETVKKIFTGMGDLIGKAFKGGVNLIVGFINGRIDSFNGLIEQARNLPGMNWIPKMWPIPEYARGGVVVQSSNMQLVGERGPELVSMPSGTSVTTANRTEKILANNNNDRAIELHIHIENGAGDYDSLIRKMKDAFIRELLPTLKKELK